MKKKKRKRKNRASCLVIMLTPGDMVIKMCKMAHFLCFLLMPAKISHSVDKIFTCIWNILNGSFRKCYRLLDSGLPLARYQPWSFVIFFAEICFFDISTLHISRTVTLKPINHTIFGKNSIFQVRLNVLPKLWLNFCCCQQKYKKWAIFDILMTITPGGNMVTRQMTLFFSSTFRALSVGIFHFSNLRPSKFSFMGSPFCIMFWSVKYTFTCQRWNFQAY